ncbi:MAG: nucleoside triphosphate pyrophosphohydrolase family protein [Actinobacteria bacterium]|nr:nucleoside triphosphate pyrophosphohydrolase family protein [Actinomycetota bacterium]
MANNFDDVGNFHEKFGLDNVTFKGPGPREVPDELIRFRIGFLVEELEEFIAGAVDGDDEQMFDALLDLAYVAFGTAHLLGYPWQVGWDEVQRANMKKIRAAKDGSNSKRGSSFDVVKPPHWTPPDIKAVLEKNGWNA